MSNKLVRRIKKFEDVPQIRPRVFKIEREDEDLEFEWRPLTFQQSEEIRTKFTRPVPPMKPLPLGAKELTLRAERGLATETPDETNPEYQEKLRQYEAAVGMETLRIALGWDMPHEEFMARAGETFVKGELDSFLDEVTNASFKINPELLNRFLRNLAPEQNEDKPPSKSETI